MEEENKVIDVEYEVIDTKDEDGEDITENNPIIEDEDINALIENIDKLPLMKILNIQNTFKAQLMEYDRIKSLFDMSLTINDNVSETTKNIGELIEGANKEIEALNAVNPVAKEEFLENYNTNKEKLTNLIGLIDTKIRSFGSVEEFEKVSFITDQLILSTKYDIDILDKDDLNYDIKLKALQNRLKSIENRTDHTNLISKITPILSNNKFKKLYLSYDKNKGKYIKAIKHLLKLPGTIYSYFMYQETLKEKYGNDFIKKLHIVIDRLIITDKNNDRLTDLKMFLLNIISIYVMENPKEEVDNITFDIVDDIDEYKNKINEIFELINNAKI